MVHSWPYRDIEKLLWAQVEVHDLQFLYYLILTNLMRDISKILVT